MKLVLAEKPSVAQSIAKVLGAAKREDGYLEGNGYVVSWCVGHLVELAQPEAYDAKYSKWAYADLPIFPMNRQYEVSAGTKKQFGILKKLMAREDVASLVCATDAGREGELIFEGEMASLKRFKDDVKEVGTNFECGISLTNCNDIKVGDIIEAYEEVEVKQTL